MTTQISYGASDPVAEPYDYEVPLTGFSLTPQTSLLVINPAGTLATGTIIFPTNPINGQRLGFISTQTQTAVTLTAGTGDTINGAVTAGVANTRYNYAYRLANRTWYRV